MITVKRIIAASVLASVGTFIFYNTQKEKLEEENLVDDKTTQDGVMHASVGEGPVSRRNLAAGIHQMMGGQVAVGGNGMAPWEDILNTQDVYTSHPFRPREYSGTGTEFIHYKNVTEQDASGSTTFPPTRRPIEQFSGWFAPTDSPSRVPTRYPVTMHPTEDEWWEEWGETPDPTGEPTKFPTKFPTKNPTKGPTKNPSPGPTKLPTRQPSPGPSKLPTRFPTKQPTRFPTKQPTRDPSGGPTKEPTPNPTRFPTKFPTKQPTKNPSPGPSKVPTRQPTKGPTKNPSPGPTKEPTRFPTKGPTKDPSPGPTKEPTRFPTKNPSPGPTKFPTQHPTGHPLMNDFGGPTPGYTIVDMGAGPTPMPVERPRQNFGSFYCGSSMQQASMCETPCPNGIADCATGFCYAVASCPTQFNDQIVDNKITPFPTPWPTPNPTNRPVIPVSAKYCGSSVYEASLCEIPCNSIGDCPQGFCYAVSQCMDTYSDQVTPDPTRFPTPNPSPGPTKEPTREPTRFPTKEPTPFPTPYPTKFPTPYPTGDPSPNYVPGPDLPSDDFYCGNSLEEASDLCEYSCPTGSPTDCPGSLTCYASTGCVDRVTGDVPPPTRSPSSDPSGSFYCGSSFQLASQQCEVPCPDGASTACPEGQACYANTPCQDKDGFYCGGSLLEASSTCSLPCPDQVCPDGLTCYETVTCKTWGGPTSAPVVLGEPDVEEGTKYCGYSYEDAATTCSLACPTGLSTDCPQGMSCYSHTPCEDTGSFYCGVSWNNAASSCRIPCPSGSDSECPTNTHCYAYTNCDETANFMCGYTFENASSDCDKPCPTGSPTECPDPQMSCFTHTTCSPMEPASSPTDPATTPTSDPYIPGDSYFCGTSFLEASSQCTHPCPTRLDSQCPDGEQCYGNTPCPTRETYYCGANLDEASGMCEYPCPSGSSADCPTGLSCFAFTTCADKDTFYCGDNYIDAGDLCDTPCPTGLSSDCPNGLTCFPHTTCAIEPASSPVPETSTVGSHYCGATFDEATQDCSLPCPSGLDSYCPTGMKCWPHTSCTDRDSFMCGYTWDDAASTCSDPCPSGEHSACPEGMSCFAYTPCNNAGSFFCGTSFDEASDCNLPCPSGDSSQCPLGLSCFSYTSCGTGDFNTPDPTSAPTPKRYVPEDSFYCGSTFDDASQSCEFPCPEGSINCPTGLACFEYTTCVGRNDPDSPSSPPTKETDTFYCGMNYSDAENKCEVACPGGSATECPNGEMCIPFTTCNSPDDGLSDVGVPQQVLDTYYCGDSKEDADVQCAVPCPNGPTDCPFGSSCFSFTECAPLPYSEPATDPATPPPAQSPASVPSTDPNSPSKMYCGTSFEDATSQCNVPCPSGSSSECPLGLSCYGYTSCDDKDSFYCGTSWDEAASTCSKPCPDGDNSVCPNGEVCFGYTPCNIAPDTDIPVESFYCGTTFEEASLECAVPCPSGEHDDCPGEELCHPYTPCGERDSYFCGTSWTDAATSCNIPCPSGSSSECPPDEFCFPSTPCDETDSFFCGYNFEDATTVCNIPCPEGQSARCPDGQGCFAYTLCNEHRANAVPTPTLAPIPQAPTESFFCGTSYDDASTVCTDECPSGLSSDCPDGTLCFAATPCSDRASFFCGDTWEEAAASCTLPCPDGTNTVCPNGQQCFGYTPCSKTESFYCGTTFEEASLTCTDPCPTGDHSVCPTGESCHKYTPCDDIVQADGTPPGELPYPEDSYYCGLDFVDASERCYLPCPSGNAAECPVGEACYGNTLCSGGDTFYCGETWYDASSDCLDPCPSGLDKDCPDGSKCFGYTPCADTNSYYCGTDFLDASKQCLIPCPDGSSTICPIGQSCFPNTPCGDGSGPTPVTTGNPTNMPTPLPTPLPTKVPTHIPTNQPTFLMQEFSATTPAPHISMFLYCGTDIDNVDCMLPCPNGDECPIGFDCYATQDCSDTFYCGFSFNDANSTCLEACPDGKDETCPGETKCYAQTTCADRPPKDSPENPIDVGTYYCGKNYTDAATSCPLACPSGSSAECAELGIEYACYGNTPCDDTDTYYCGTTWSHAASNCLFPCPTGDDSTCPDGTFCFPYTSCGETDSFMCGTTFDHASSCERPCPSGSSSECPYGESCFTHTGCRAKDMEPMTSPTDPASSPAADPTTPPTYVPGESFFCGTSFLDAAERCTDPCPSRLDEDCPDGQQCWANTPCPDRETYYCGRSLDEASASCEFPCPTGRSEQCPEDLSCFAFTKCADRSSYFCGTNYLNASTTCETPCESGLSEDCPGDLSCFAFTTCNIQEGDEPLPGDTAYCGVSFDEASRLCTNPCESTLDCPFGEACFPFTTCQPDGEPVANANYAPDSFFCGTTFEETSMTCTNPCPSGSHADCPSNQFCFPNTPCDDHASYYCGTTWTDAATSCTLPCPSGSSRDCPMGMSCFPSTPCDETNSFFCGTTFEDASADCAIPCPLGKSDTCPDGMGCFPYTLCNEDGTNAVPTDPLAEIPAAPLDSHYCGLNFDDATTSCEFECPSGKSSDCPGDLACYAGTSCEASKSFFCGVSWDEASNSCALPCESGLSKDCPTGETCYGYTPCMNTDTFYCGETFEEASTSCGLSCPSGLDSDCPGSTTCHKYTTCSDGIPTFGTVPEAEDEVPEGSFYCGLSFDDASSSCAIPCPSRSSTQCPLGQACFAHTICEMDADPATFYCGKTIWDAESSCADPCPNGSIDCPTGTSCYAYTACNDPMKEMSDTPAFVTEEPPEESWFCGVTFEDASTECAIPCASNDCPSGSECFPYTTCMGTEPGSYYCGENFEDASRCTQACPSGSSAQCPSGQACYAYTACASFDISDKPDFTPGFVTEEPPEESWFCGVTFEDASTECAVPCASNDCPSGSECFPYTTCVGTEPESYYCGKNYEDASRCTKPCPSGSSADCPFGEACYAYTDCASFDISPPEDEIIPNYSAIPAESYYCGLSYEDASEKCSIPCESRDSADCPGIEQCFAYTPCSRPQSFFCGKSLDDANTACAVPCPTGKSNTCPSGESCYAYTICNPLTAFDTQPSCQISLSDDWLSADPDTISTIDVLANDTTACGGDLRVFAANAIPPPEDWEDDRRLLGDDWEQWWCGPPQTEEEYNVTFIPHNGFRGNAFCSYQACDGSTCETATIYIDVSAPITAPPTNYPTPNPTRYPTPLPTTDPTPSPTNYPTPFPTKYPTNFPTKYPTPWPTKFPTKYPTNFPTKYPTPFPTKYPTNFPTKYPTPFPTKYPTPFPTKYPTTHPSKSPIIPVTFDVPEDSFYCGVTFNHASDLCGVPCPGGNGDCPPGLKCYGNTPCGDRKSFFCGSDYEDANGRCTDHCPTGSANECPSGQSCFAYTMCRHETDEPTEEPTWSPSLDPTKKPTPGPTKFPTRWPTKYPTNEPTKYPTDEPTPWPTKYPTDEPTPSPTESMQQNLGNPDESDNFLHLKPNPPEEDDEKDDAPDESNFIGQLKPQKPEDEEDEKEETPQEEEDEKEEEKDDAPDESEEEEDEKEETPDEQKEETPDEQKEETPDEQKEETPDEEEDQKDQPPDEKLDTPDQSDALVIEIKPCEDPLAMTVNQAYWRSWSSDHPETCNKFEASDIDATTYTHLVYSFASISADGMLEPWVGSWDEVDKYKEFNKVKERNSDVKTIIAVTEGIFYGAGMNPVTFHEVAETDASRMAFAQSVVSFLKTYEFDGLDIDWESPLDRDKGGDPKNYERFVQLAKEIRGAIDKSGEDYIFSIALPPTDWELYDYDVEGLSEHVDWFNLMSFDYHTPKNIPKTVGAHSDLKLIDYVVSDLLQGTASTKFVLGMAAYGRTYTLADDRCKELGCPFRSPGLGGCAKTPGFLPFKEIQEYIEDQSYDELHQDVSSSSMVAVVDEDQMLSFDDETTWAIKEDYAEMMCLRGTMLWSIDMLKPSTSHRDPDGGGRKLLSASDSSNSCDICGPGSDMQLIESQQVSYAGTNTTCGDVSTSFHLNAKEFSFKCSLARTSLMSTCCAESCQVCPTGSEVKGDAMIMHEGEEISCADYNLALKGTGFLQGSDECDYSASLFSETCCSGIEESNLSLDSTSSDTQCNICVRDNVHHELKSEAMVEYKGTSISCLDLNSILAKSEAETSDICLATQSMLFDGCCYEKCSLCGEKSLRWDARVRFNNQILSCDELDSMFTLGMIRDGSDQCGSMQSAYSSVCCFNPPKNKCELCNEGSVSLEVNTHAFVKTRSTSLHCTTLVNSLAETEEEDSETCIDSKSAYSSTCCNSSSKSSLRTEDNLYYEWLNDDQSTASSDAARPTKLSLWSLIVATLLFVFHQQRM